jgi:hypothetical protein
MADNVLVVAVTTNPQAVADVAIRPQRAQSGILILEYQVRLCGRFGWYSRVEDIM